MFGPDIGVTLFAALLTLSISLVFWVRVCLARVRVRVRVRVWYANPNQGC